MVEVLNDQILTLSNGNLIVSVSYENTYCNDIHINSYEIVKTSLSQDELENISIFKTIEEFLKQ